jgi:hypothetical protein
MATAKWLITRGAQMLTIPYLTMPFFGDTTIKRGVINHTDTQILISNIFHRSARKEAGLGRRKSLRKGPT